MLEGKFVISNKMGLHARPAAVLAQLANKFRSEVHVIKNGIEVNAKSIMGLMMLAAEHGSEICLKVWGEDEARAFESIAKLFENKFHEQ